MIAPLPTSPEIARVYRRVRCEDSLHYFMLRAWPLVEPGSPFKAGWHIEAICEHLQAVTSGEIQNLLVNISPGCAKSTLVSVMWPVWEWSRNPTERFLTASYSQDLATRDSIKRRHLIESSWFQSNWPLGLTGDTNTKTNFANTRTGWMLSTSVGGRGTGEHPTRFVGDDLHNVRGSESDVERQSVLDWFDGTITSRGAGIGVRRVIVGQRLHQRDICGHLEAKGGWELLKIPMRYEGEKKATVLGWTDPRKTIGELMWPAHFDEVKTKKLETEMGSARAAGQLQQRPSPAGGGMFKRAWFEIVKVIPAGGRAHRHWDLAATEAAQGKNPDWTAGVRMRKSKDGIFYIDSIIRMQQTGLTVERAILNTATIDGRAVTISVPQDPGQAGKVQAAQFVRQLAGYTIKPIIESGSKEVRSEPFSAQCEAGNVKLLEGKWNEEFLSECETFPVGDHDDQIDAAAHAFHSLLSGGTITMRKLSGF